MRRGLLVAGIVGVVVLGLAPAASAHPLGNFTVNTADRIVVGKDDLRIEHVVDNAEIPTLQISQSSTGPDADHDGTLTQAELSAWAASECARDAPELALTVDGERATLAVTSSTARSLPGAAGLKTLRLDCSLTSSKAPRSKVDFRDPTSSGRTGWKEVSATALCGRLTDTGDLPGTSPSTLLTAYPQDLLSSPLDITSASFGITAAGACRADGVLDVPAPSTVLPRGVDRLTTSYTSFVSRQHLSLPLALLALLLSVALGCGHAVAPGHGKTVIAAYLVGQRGTKRQALWLGATVTATHTAGVLLLGLLLSLTSVASPERFVPATEVASGLLLGGVGVFLFRRAVRLRRSALPVGGHGLDDHGHAHGPDDHDHGHAHGPDDHGHAHGPGGDGHAHGPDDRGHAHGPDDHGHAHGPDDHAHAHGPDGDRQAHELGVAHAAAVHAHEDHGHDELRHGHPHDDHGHPHDDHGHRHDDLGHGHDDHGHRHDDHGHPHEELMPAAVLTVASPAPGSDGALRVSKTRRRTPAPAPALVHSHGGRAHSHLPPADAPIGWRTLATMGIAGGLVPSPSALVVLLGASALGRPVFGALLVVGYGVGMALTLTVAGLLLLRAQAVLDRRGWTTGRGALALRVLPLFTAAVVLVVGLIIVLRGIVTFHNLG